MLSLARFGELDVRLVLQGLQVGEPVKALLALQPTNIFNPTCVTANSNKTNRHVGRFRALVALGRAGRGGARVVRCASTRAGGRHGAARCGLLRSCGAPPAVAARNESVRAFTLCACMLAVLRCVSCATCRVSHAHVVRCMLHDMRVSVTNRAVPGLPQRQQSAQTRRH